VKVVRTSCDCQVGRSSLGRLAWLAAARKHPEVCELFVCQLALSRKSFLTMAIARIRPNEQLRPTIKPVCDFIMVSGADVLERSQGKSTD
jgi:hypothetical protein